MGLEQAGKRRVIFLEKENQIRLSPEGWFSSKTIWSQFLGLSEQHELVTGFVIYSKGQAKELVSQRLSFYNFKLEIRSDWYIENPFGWTSKIDIQTLLPLKCQNINSKWENIRRSGWAEVLILRGKERLHGFDAILNNKISITDWFLQRPQSLLGSPIREHHYSSLSEWRQENV